MIKPWLFEFLPELRSPSTEPNAADVTALFRRYLDLWVRDERLASKAYFSASTTSVAHIPPRPTS
jgi:hypothetical protein